MRNRPHCGGYGDDDSRIEANFKKQILRRRPKGPTIRVVRFSEIKGKGWTLSPRHLLSLNPIDEIRLATFETMEEEQNA